MSHPTAGYQCGATSLGLSEEAEHIGVRVDDAGRGRIERSFASELRLERERTVAAEELQCDAVGLRCRFDPFEVRELRFRGGDNEFPATSIGNPVLLAEVVEQVATGDAHPGPERAAWVVDARVDYLTVARADSSSEMIRCLEYQNLAASHGECACHGKSNDSRTDHDHIDVVHVDKV